MNILIILMVFGGLCAAYGVLLKRVALRGLGSRTLSEQFIRDCLKKVAVPTEEKP